MNEYTATIDGGQGGTTVVEAQDWASAANEAEEWALAGSWPCDCDVLVRVSGQDGDDTFTVNVSKNI